MRFNPIPHPKGSSPSRALRSALALCVIPWLGAGAFQARAAAYLSVEEALELTFPGADEVETRSFVLTSEQLEQIQERAGAPLDSQLLSIYVGVKDGAPMGYALIDVHTVRTVDQALMIVVTPERTIASIRVLAFYEPEEYLPTERFRGQYEGLELDNRLQLGQAVQGVAGATLSSVATTRAVRRSLALVNTLIPQPATPAPAADVASDGPAPSAATAPSE